MKNEIVKIQTLAGRLTANPIVKITDEKSNLDAANNFKTQDALIKEATEIAKELKRPYQDKINQINTILKSMEIAKNEQKKEIGRYNIELMKKMNEKNDLDLTKMKTQSQVNGKVSSYEWPDAKIIDLLIFLTALMDGKQGDILDLIQIKPGEALNKFCDKWKLTAFPGLEIKTQIKVENR